LRGWARVEAVEATAVIGQRWLNEVLNGVLDSLLYFHDYGNMEIKQAVAALGALAQDTRLAIFRLLVEAGPEGMPAGRISEMLDVAPATLSFHLKELSHAGLAHARPEGRFLFYSADFEHMAALMTFLTQNCCRGMPDECLTTVETALSRCSPSSRGGVGPRPACGPAPVKRQTRRSRQ
jgi:DNA-binding transcriptional ArsR family regulator